MKNINDHIKQNTFNHCYLLIGEEDYLKQQMKNNLSKAIIGDDTMNRSVFKEKPDEKEICELARTLPFFSERRLIILDSSDFFSWASDDLCGILNNMPDYLYIIIIENSADKRKKTYKAIQKAGYICELKTRSQGDLRKFIQGKCKEEGVDIDPAAADALISATNGDLNTISNELDKLFAYTLDKGSINAEDIKKVCSISLEEKVFDMIEAIGKRDNKKAMSLYRDLVALKEPPVKILILMERQFMGIAQVKGSANVEASQIGMKGVPPFVLKKYREQAANFSMDELKGLLKVFEDTEYRIKTGLISDRNGLEIVIAGALGS